MTEGANHASSTAERRWGRGSIEVRALLVGRRMKPSRLLLAVALAALASAGCSPGTTTVIDGPYALYYTSGGGFSGESEQIVVDSAAKTISASESDADPPRTATLTDAEIAHIADLIEEADLKHPGEPSTCACSDSSGSQLVLKTGGKSYDTGWESGESPDERIALRRAVSELAEQKVPAPGSP
jgi:hypothetical protein